MNELRTRKVALPCGSGRLRKTVEVANFLGKEHREVLRLVEDDGLPAVKIPGRLRPTVRFYLPDLHAWMQKMSSGSGLEDLEEFVRAFDAAQGGGGRR